MNEIEELYENAGVSCKPNYVYNKVPILSGIEYPLFTAEKQIELIKWLAKKDCIYRLTYERDFLWSSQLEWQTSFCYESFEESLANLINTIWQDLTEEERKQIKEILK